MNAGNMEFRNRQLARSAVAQGPSRNISRKKFDGNIGRVVALWWRGGATGKAFGLAISRSRVQILLEATLRNNLRQVVHTYVPLSPSSITWYQPKGGDALRLGR